MRSGLVRCLDGGGAVESRCVWHSADDLVRWKDLGRQKRKRWAPSNLLCSQGFRSFIFWGHPWKGVIQQFCCKAGLWYVQRGFIPEKMFDRNFCLGQGPSPIRMKVERRVSPEAFVKKQYRIFSIFDLESLRTLAPSLWNIWIFFAPSRLQ